MSMKWVLSAIVLLTLSASASLRAQSCESLSKFASPGVSITLTKVTSSGAFTISDSTKSFPDLPAFCRVAAKPKPASDSDIGIEVWLPLTGWNGKFVAVGSGGWGGAIDYSALADALRRGYATSATDDGHIGAGARFIMGHPEKFIDFAYRAQHERYPRREAPREVERSTFIAI
jgi:feruloyl esterase